jgi:hypothetical protein
MAEMNRCSRAWSMIQPSEADGSAYRIAQPAATSPPGHVILIP